MALVSPLPLGGSGREVEIAAFAFFDLVEQTRKTLDPQRVSSPKPRPGWDMTWKKSGARVKHMKLGSSFHQKGVANGMWANGD